MNNEHKIAQLLLRSWPFPRGAGRLADRFFSSLRFSEDHVSVQTSDGFTITVNPNELIGRHLYLMGEFDRSIVELLCNFAEPEDVLLDVGANIGYVSASFLHHFPGGRVVAVEPQAGVIDLLRTNLSTDRAVIAPYALSDRDGEIAFRLDIANTGAGRIVDEEYPDVVRVKAKSPASLFADISRMDLVKIDVEGHEAIVVRACLSYFERLRPKAIIFEDSANKSREIAAMLDGAGYRTFGIRKSLTSLRLVPSLDHHDCIAVSKLRALPARARTIYGI